MKYYYKRSVYKRLRRWQRTHRTFTALLIVLFISLALGGLLGWEYLNKLSLGQKSKLVDLGFYSPTLMNSYDNEVFSFKSTRKWEFNRTLSSLPETYVFISKRNTLVEYKLTVYVGEVPSLPVKYIQPVTISGGSLIPGIISPICGDSNNTNRDPYASLKVPKVYKKINYICDLESSSAIIAAGHAGGSYSLPLTAQNNKPVNIGLFFQDQTASLHPNVFEEIIENFKLK